MIYSKQSRRPYYELLDRPCWRLPNKRDAASVLINRLGLNRQNYCRSLLSCRENGIILSVNKNHHYKHDACSGNLFIQASADWCKAIIREAPFSSYTYVLIRIQALRIKSSIL